MIEFSRNWKYDNAQNRTSHSWTDTWKKKKTTTKSTYRQNIKRFNESKQWIFPEKWMSESVDIVAHNSL